MTNCGTLQWIDYNFKSFRSSVFNLSCLLIYCGQKWLKFYIFHNSWKDLPNLFTESFQCKENTGDKWQTSIKIVTFFPTKFFRLNFLSFRRRLKWRMQQKKKKKHNLLSNGKNHANIHQASIMFTNVFLKDCMLLSFKFYWENGVVRGKCFARIIFSQGTVT